MFCKNCGQPYVTDEAVICVKCGTKKGVGENYCPNCGQPTQPGGPGMFKLRHSVKWHRFWREIKGGGRIACYFLRSVRRT